MLFSETSKVFAKKEQLHHATALPYTNIMMYLMFQTVLISTTSYQDLNSLPN